MATYTVSAGALGAHAKTTSGGVEDVVNFASEGPVEVMVESGAGVYFTLNGAAATVAGAGTYYVPVGSSLQPSQPTSQVRLISSGAAVYHVVRAD